MIRRARYLSILPLALLATNDARATDLDAFHAYAQEKPVTKVTAPAGARGFVASTDDKRGTPTFFWAQKGQSLPASLARASLEQQARHHLNTHADLYGLTKKSLQTAKLVMTHDTGRGGRIAVFRQYLAGLEILDSDMKVLIDRQGKLVAFGGALHPGAAVGADKKWGAFSLTGGDAVGKALQDLYGVKLPSSSFTASATKKSGYDLFTLAAPFMAGTTSHAFVAPARAKKVYFPMPQALVPAYYVEVEVTSDNATPDSYAYVIAANDGRLLRRVSLTEYDTYQYRVWADTTAPYTPQDGPITDFTPHPTGMQDESVPGFTTPNLISMEGFNTNPMGMADPWLPAGATETKGNNIDAYTDHTDCTPAAAGQPATACTAAVAAANEGFTAGVDFRASTTAPGVFDRTYDTAISPVASQAQSMAATTQLFYTNNWLHDYWYDSGFTEAAGNAQSVNFGRGGEEGDVLLAQAQDKALGVGTSLAGAARNNANMSTPRDGRSPRMQMFLWSNDEGVLDVGTPINKTYPTGTASFGPRNFELLNQTIVLGVDGVVEPPTTPGGASGTVTDGCSALPGSVAGKVVMVDRGYCGFAVKAANAKAANAAGLIIANNSGTNPVGMGGSADLTLPPTLSISKPNGDAVKAALGAGAVTISRMKRISGVEHDGTIDNTIIAHEWGHYIHHRLVNTGSNQGRSQSEGWGDFIAAHMASRAGDNYATGTFAMAIYSTVSFYDEGYYGIRRLPYSRDMAKNPLTFKHIADENPLPAIPLGSGGSTNSEVHNAGEVWTAMLWDAYTALIMSGKYSFDMAKRKMADYMVGGMMMAPTDATFNEQRDGILAYVASVDNEDMVLMANQFARRGLGTCSISPARYSNNHNGLVESTTLSGKQEVVSAKVDDSILSCDSDGVLDSGEKGKVTVEVLNNGAVPLANTTVSVLARTPGVSFIGPTSTMIASLASYAKTNVTFDVALAPGMSATKRIDLEITAQNDSGCETTHRVIENDRIDIDDTASNSTTDDVSSEKGTWTLSGAIPDEVWVREHDDSFNFQWHGADYPTDVDSRLESADINVAATGNFIVSFDHAYSFEVTIATPPAQNTNWDGGLLEISKDGGQTWEDVSMYVDPGYGGPLYGQSGNPLGGRQAFVGQSAGYPAKTTKTLDFGTALAGQTVRFRFRIATDAGVGGPGWEIDNIKVQGVTNTPFSSVAQDAGICNGVPKAFAGADQTVTEGDTVTLNGSASSDPDNDPLTYAWTQSAGPTVTLSDATAAQPTFVAPDITDPTVVSFQLSVSDGKGTAGDTIDVVVLPIPSMGSGGSGGAGGAGGAGVGGAGVGGAGGGTGGTAGAGVGGAGGAGGATGGMGGMGTGGMSEVSSSSSSSSSSGGTAGSGGGTPTDGGDCDCSVAGDNSGPVRPGMLGSLGLLLGLVLRRRNRK